MIPHPREAMSFIVQRLMSETLPELKSTYAMADLALISSLLKMFAQDLDRGSLARLDDIREMRDLFAAAGDFDSRSPLGKQIAAASSLALRDAKVERLDEILDSHFRALIALHTDIERRMDTGDADARRLDGDIWAFLERHAERHRYDVEGI